MSLFKLVGTYMSKKLYVGNLNFAVTNHDLEGMFSPFGAVQSANVITERDTGQSKGFGFVEMESASDANAAITALNGKDMGGRNLTVNEARPRGEGGAGGSFGSGANRGPGGPRGGFGGGRRY